MTPTPVRVTGALVGVTTTVAAGSVAGGWWWVVALAGAAASAGSIADRHLAHAHVLATLVLAVGLSIGAFVWFVPVLVAGAIGSIELGASADRTTVVRPVPPQLRRAVLTAPAAAVVSAAVLVAAELPFAAFSGAAVAAALAGVVATRVIAR